MPLRKNYVNKQKSFIARQLNDHQSSRRGVRQGTHHTWDEAHIDDALSLAVGYLYSIRPDEFAKTKTFALASDSCTFNIPCGNTLDVVSIGSCNNVVMQEAANTNNLMPLLGDVCGVSGDADPEKKTYTIEKIAKNSYMSTDIIPKGTVITYVCADKDNLRQSTIDQHDSLITAFALWWLLLTDNESRTNLDRANLYYAMVRNYVETSLLLEFSLNEDDYKFGRRKVDD